MVSVPPKEIAPPIVGVRVPPVVWIRLMVKVSASQSAVRVAVSPTTKVETMLVPSKDQPRNE